MKRFGFFMLIGILAIGAVFAQKEETGRRNPPRQITVEGTLQLQNGMIAITRGNTVYFVPTLHRYAGFIEGLKEGNNVSIEGFAFKNFLRPTKVTVSGKAYDFPARNFGQRQGHGFEQKPFGQPKPAHRHERHGHGRGHRNWNRNR